MIETLISIIVPVYNVEEYIKECIDSIINQDYKNIEVILVDDGSTDMSPQICDEYTKKDNRIKVIHKENEGVSAARNVGIEKSNGEWITFVDADDWIEKNYISSMYKVIDKHTGIVIGRTIAVEKDVEIHDGYKGKMLERFSGESKKELFKSIFNDNIKSLKYPHISTCSAKLIRKSIIIENNILYDTDLKYYEDAIFNIEIICLSEIVKIIDEKIYKYRLNLHSVTKIFDINTIKYYENAYKKFDEISKKYNFNFKQYIDIFKIKNLNTIILNYLKTEKNMKTSLKFIHEICNNVSYKEALKKVKLSILPKRRKILIILYRIRFYYGIYLLYKI